jgi:hypothetical protein
MPPNKPAEKPVPPPSPPPTDPVYSLVVQSLAILKALQVKVADLGQQIAAVDAKIDCLKTKLDKATEIVRTHNKRDLDDRKVVQ